MKTPLLGKPVTELQDLMAAWGQPAWRGRQLYEAIYRQRTRDLSAIRTLPAPLREKLASECVLGWPEIHRQYRAADGTIRYLLKLSDGQGVETVLMPEDGTISGAGPRDTICLSTQVGCAVDCHFCLTAQL